MKVFFEWRKLVLRAMSLTSFKQAIAVFMPVGKSALTCGYRLFIEDFCLCREQQ
jgi:hypothetical protein